MDFKTLLEIECKGLTGFSPVIKDSEEELRSFLTLGSDIEILVVDDPQNNVMNSIDQNSSAKNILVLSDSAVTKKQNKVLPL